MAVITPEIKEFIQNNLGWITTVSKDGELDLEEAGLPLPRQRGAAR